MTNSNNMLANWVGGGSDTTLLFFFILLVLVFNGKGYAYGEDVGTAGLFGCGGSNWIIWLLLILCLCGGNTWK